MAAEDRGNRYESSPVEALHINNMSASARGKNDSPGRGVRAKSGLNKAIRELGVIPFLQGMEDVILPNFQRSDLKLSEIPFHCL